MRPLLATLKKLVRADAPARAAAPRGRRPRILYFIWCYPTFSETYMHEEIRSLWADYDIEIVTLRPCDVPRARAFPHHIIPYRDPDMIWGPIEQVDLGFGRPAQVEFLREAGAVIERFKPDLMHGHYLGIGHVMRALAERHAIPFTIRTHSFDVLSEPPERLAAGCRAASSEWCVGVIAFPGMRARLQAEGGLDPARVSECWPVINFARFYQPEPRPATGGVLCTGPAVPKKGHGDFIDLAARMRGSGRFFELYARGYALPDVEARNAALGNPARITYADPDEMPNVYPRFDWLVYTAERDDPKVGFPCSIPEAQASGIGVCWQELPGRRQEQLDFLGGAGLLFRDLAEVPALLEKPYPEEMRRLGFQAARRSDVEGHKHVLTGLWARALARPAAR